MKRLLLLLPFLLSLPAAAECPWAERCPTLGGAAGDVTLGSGTSGNYVATLADDGGGEVVVTGSGSESAAVTLGLAASMTRDSELQSITVSTSDPVDDTDACNPADLWINNGSGTEAMFVCVTGNGSTTGDWWTIADPLTDAP